VGSLHGSGTTVLEARFSAPPTGSRGDPVGQTCGVRERRGSERRDEFFRRDDGRAKLADDHAGGAFGEPGYAAVLDMLPR